MNKESLEHIKKETLIEKPLELDQEKKEERMVENALGRLEDLEILEKKEGRFIIDLDKFSSTIRKRKGIEKLGPIYNSPSSSTRFKAWPTLYKVFHDKEVISKKDWEEGDRTPRPLFYFPEKEEDFDIKEIKKNKFYLAPFEYSTIRLDQPMSSEDLEASFLDASVAAIIYHPRFGDGYRDEKGQVFVRDKKTGKYKKLSSTFFEDYKFLVGDPRKYGNSIIAHPRAFVRRKLPFLIKAGLLYPSDFKILSGYRTAEHERIEKKNLNERGVIMINRVLHYLGRNLAKKLAKEDFRIIQLDEGLGGIVLKDEKGEEKLGYVFNILEPSPELKVFKGNFPWAEKEKTNPRPYNPREKLPKRADETEQDYQKRIEALENFDYLLKFSQKLADETDIQIFRYPFEYQKILIYGFKALKEKEEEIIDFVKKYKEPGLLAFLSSEYEGDNGKKILKIAEALPKPDLESIFVEYSEIMELANEFKKTFRESLYLKESNLPQEIKERFPIDIHEAILRRAKDLLISPYPIFVEKKETEFQMKDVIIGLKGLRKFLEIMRDFRKENIEHEINFIKKVTNNDLDNFFYEVKDKNGHEYKFKIGIRPKETESGQARINFELNFNTENPNEELKQAFSQEVFYKRENKTKKFSRLRIAVDREFIEGKEFLSLDIGRDKREDKDFKRTGDVLGRILAFVSKTGHHNPDSFDPRYAQKEIFSEISKTFRQYLEERDKISS